MVRTIEVSDDGIVITNMEIKNINKRSHMIAQQYAYGVLIKGDLIKKTISYLNLLKTNPTNLD